MTTASPRRIVFTRFTGHYRSDLHIWQSMVTSILSGDDSSLEFPERVFPPPRTERDVDPRAFIWRIVSGRRLELAMCTKRFATLAEARQDALRMVTAADELSTVKVSGKFGPHYTWYKTVHGDPIVCARRWYPSYQGRNQSSSLIDRIASRVTIGETADPRYPGFGVHASSRSTVPPPEIVVSSEPLKEAPPRKPIIGPSRKKKEWRG